MKKVFLFLLTIMLLSGCSQEGGENVVSDEQMTLYSSSYQAVLDNTAFSEESSFFEISYEVVQSEAQHVYYVFVDNPKVAMYDIELIVLENLDNFNTQKMMPTFGIFDSIEYHMIPFQVDAEKGYVKGIMVSGELEEVSGPLYMMVTWKNYTRLQTYREYFVINLHEPIEEDGPVVEIPVVESTSPSGELEQESTTDSGEE